MHQAKSKTVEASVAGMMLGADIFSAFRADLGEYSVQASALHALRRLRVYGMMADYDRLLTMPAFHHHLATIDQSDPLFFLAHRYYLAEGLTTNERLQMALSHYGHEGRFGQDYTDQVYLNGGLTLWRDSRAGVDYDIRLMPANDVLYEGGLSIVFHVDGSRVCVLSFSVVPVPIVLPDWSENGRAPTEIIFITRKQLTQERGYQAAFNKAFDRTTPALLCFAALSGLASARGYNQVIGIAPERHPSFSIVNQPHFQAAYSDFWLSLGGVRHSPYGYLIDVPARLTPLEHLDSSRRKRAIARRAHMDSIAEATSVATPSLMRS